MPERIYFGAEFVGGSLRVGILCDSSGKILATVRKRGGVALYTTPLKEQDVFSQEQCSGSGSDGTGSSIGLLFCELVLELTLKAGLSAENYAATICVGMTGIGHPYDVECEMEFHFRTDDVLSTLPFKEVRIVCTGDAEITFAGFTQADNGSAIICNAGSVFLSVADGLITRSGGWGPAFGDDGSGYDMGRNALRRLTHWHDSGGNDDNGAWERFFTHLDKWIQFPSNVGGRFTLATGFQRQTAWEQVSAEWRKVRTFFLQKYPDSELPRALIPFCYGSLRSLGPEKWWSMVSSLIIPVAECWQLEVKEGLVGPATEVIDQAVLRMVDAYLRCTKGQICSPLVLAGGVLNHQPQLADQLLCKLRIATSQVYAETFNSTTVRSKSALRPAVGAVLLALGDTSNTQGLFLLTKIKMPSPEIVSKIRVEVASQEWLQELANV